MPNYARQRVQTANLVETGQGGQATRRMTSTAATAPGTSSPVSTPGQVAHLIDVDYQTTTYLLTAANGTWTSVTWPSVGFTGFCNNTLAWSTGAQTQGSTGATSANSGALITSLSTQLVLCCSVQVVNAASNVILAQTNILTNAFDNQINTAYVGPFFPPGTSYLAFSCTPSGYIYNNTGGNLTASPVTIGISAQLFFVLIQ